MTARESAEGVLRIDFCYWSGCPIHPAAWSEVLRALLVYGALAEIHVHEVVTDQDAIRRRFYGSPTIRIDGADIDE